MQPTILDVSLFGHVLAIDARGLCLTLGALAALGVATLLARRNQATAVDLRDLGIELILVGLLGARLFHVALHAGPYVAACRAALDAGESALSICARPLWLWDGLSFYGGLAAALAWLAWRAPRRGLDALRLVDFGAPGLALGYAFTCVGCFLAGCCFGRPTGSPLGVRFPPESVAWQVLFDRGWLSPSAPLTPPLQPVQLYDAFAHLALFAALAWRARAGRGRLLAAFLVGHALIRLGLWRLAYHG